MRKVIVLSGPSGSGKTTWARKNHPDAVVCSADHFFIDEDTGEYHFDPSKIAIAHSECMQAFLMNLQRDDGVIVVDNTNIRHWERQNYITAAKNAGWEVEQEFFNVKSVEAIRMCAKRNSHGVPTDVVARMAIEHENTAYGVGITHHTV